MPSLKRYPLILAGLLTLLMLVPFLPGNTHLPGTFGNVHSFPWIKLCALRWLCLAFVLVELQTDGDFRWISRFGGVRSFVVLAVHALMGLVSLACLATVDKPVDPVSPMLHLLAVLMVVVVPLVVIGLLAKREQVHDLAVTPSWTWRVLIALCVLASGLAGVALNQREYAIRQQIRCELREMHAQRDAQVRQGLAELARLRPDDPLERWLPFSQADTAEVASRARETIRARPHLTAELSALLRGTDEPERTAALQFLEANARALPAELIAPVQDALVATAASMRARIVANPALPADTFDEDCFTAANLALENPEQAADFVNSIRRMRAALAGLPAVSARHPGQAALDAWLQQNDPTASHRPSPTGILSPLLVEPGLMSNGWQTTEMNHARLVCQS